MEQSVYDILSQVASTLGTTVEMLWGVLCRQALIEGISHAGLILIGASIALYGLPKLRRWAAESAKAGNESFDEALPIVKIIVTALVSLITLIVTAITLHVVLTKIVNPEYHALKYILRAVGVE